MERYLRIIRDPENRKVLSWLGGGLVVLAPALWVVITYFFPADDRSPVVTPERPAVQGKAKVEGPGIANTGTMETRDIKIDGGQPAKPED